MSDTSHKESKWHPHLDMSFLDACWHLLWKFILKNTFLFPTVEEQVLD